MKTCLHKIFSHLSQTNCKHKEEKRNKFELNTYKAKIEMKMLGQNIRRKTKKISSLKDIINKLKRNQLLKETTAELVKDQFSGLTLEMLKNEMQNAK